MMNVLTHMSDIMIPMVIFWIVGYGMVSGVKVYEIFLKGAKEGFSGSHLKYGQCKKHFLSEQ